MEKTIGDAGEVTTSSGTGVGVADDMSAYVEVFPRFIGNSAVVVSGERDTSVKGHLGKGSCNFYFGFW